MKALIRKYLHNESGATAIEYGLLVACIGIAASFGMKTFGDALYNVYTDVDDATNEVAEPIN